MLAYTKVKALAKSGGKLSEKIGGRGEGSLLYQGKGGNVHVWFRYTYADTRPLIPIGVLDSDTGQVAARDRARDLSKLLREHPDLKGWLELEAARKREAEAVERRALEAEARKGTLAEMLGDYTADLERQGKASAGEVARIFEREVSGAHPGIANMRVADIGPAEIKAILQPIWDRGAGPLHNRTRAFLHAAFQYGAKAEYDVARQGSKAFGVTTNPVAVVPRQGSAEQPGTRALDADELRAFYLGIGDTPSVGTMLASFLRMMVATGGQRPAQLLRATWGDYDLEQRTVKILDRKGRGEERVHLVPLSDRAFALLEAVRPISGAFDWPFSADGKAPLDLATLKNGINRFRAKYSSVREFTARDLRRTAKQAAMKRGVQTRLMNILQGHGHETGGLVGKHYANDPAAWLPEKRQALLAYDAALDGILGGDTSANVVQLRKVAA
ncbi:tyrosine-type recombinase/integrase [uncultured Thiodictyon sp.]|uniref:tyrosine-type recombinase/integrase n=1 Tax=uncultured Thiodictyon sp. TaxID=1846217 RepID=UPI0025D0E8B4|nr:tyrosine-type recombinase/integrase [uncultured Thiodictyon sp.]